MLGFRVEVFRVSGLGFKGLGPASETLQGLGFQAQLGSGRDFWH